MNFKQEFRKDDNNALKKIQLKHVAAEIRGKQTDKFPTIKVNALQDSGVDIPVISEVLIKVLIVGPSAWNDLPFELRSVLMAHPSKFYISLKSFFFVGGWAGSASEQQSLEEALYKSPE